MIKISTSKVNLSPKYPVFIAGHAMRKGKSQGIHDEIEAMIMWLSISGKEVVFVNADLSGLDYDFVHEAKRLIKTKINIDEDLIILSANHTHSGPLINTRSNDMPHDEPYRQYVLNTLVDGIVQGHNNWCDVSHVTCIQGQSEGFYGNRNSKDKYGDTNIYLLKFKDFSNRTIGAFVNMSCHSTVLSPEEYLLSGDLLAAIRRKLIEVIGIEPIVTNGNAGDMSNRLYRQNNDFAELDRVSSGIVNQIRHFTDEQELNLTDIKTKAFRYTVEYDTDRPTLESKLKEFESKLETVTEYDARKWIISEISGYKRKLAVDHVKLDFETSILRLGDLELVICPAELVSAFGKQIKKSSNAKVCIVWGYANGQTTYVVEASEFDGGHDGIATNLPKGYAEEYIAKILQHLF